MTQQRIFDFGSDDLTLLLNRRFQGIIPNGVYSGYILSAGSGLDIEVTGEADPRDQDGSVGIIHTKSGVTVFDLETAQTITMDPTPPLDRIDALVLSYLYSATKPVPVATIQKRQGTTGQHGTIVFQDAASIASIRVETKYAREGFNNWSVEVQAGTIGGTWRLVVKNLEGEQVEQHNNLTRATANSISSNLITVEVLTASSPGEPNTGQSGSFSGCSDPGLPPITALSDHLLGTVYRWRGEAGNLDPTGIRTYIAESIDQKPFTEQLAKYFKPQVLWGLSLTRGSARDFLSLSAGAINTPDNRVVEISDSPDFLNLILELPIDFPTTNYGVKGQILALVHQPENVTKERTPDIRYTIVWGETKTYDSVNSRFADTLEEPTQSKINAHISSMDPRRYDPGWDSDEDYYFATTLGHITLLNDNNSLYSEVVSTGRMETGVSIYVPDGSSAEQSSGSQYCGWSGLQLALKRIDSLRGQTYNTLSDENEIREGRDSHIILEGYYRANGMIVVPPGVKISGRSRIVGKEANFFRVGGKALKYDATNALWSSAVDSLDQVGVPPGGARIDITIAPTYRTGFNLRELYLQANEYLSISILDEVTTVNRLTFEDTKDYKWFEVLEDWKFSLVFTSDQLAVFDPRSSAVASISMKQSRSKLEDMTFVGGGVLVDSARECEIVDCKIPKLSLYDIESCRFRNSEVIEVESFREPVDLLNKGNTYNGLKVNRGDLGYYSIRDLYSNITHVVDSLQDNLYFRSAESNLGVINHLSNNRDSDLSLASTTLGTGSNPTTNFSTTLANEPAKRSLVVQVPTNSGVVTYFDDGQGAIRVANPSDTGGVVGSIDYVTRALILNFTDAPTINSNILIDYIIGSATFVAGSSCTIQDSSRALVLDSLSSGNTLTTCQQLLIKEFSTDNEVLHIRDLTSGIATSAEADENRVNPRLRVREGEANFGGKIVQGGGGTRVEFNRVPDTSYRVQIEIKADTNHPAINDLIVGLVGEVSVIYETDESFVVGNTGWTAGVANPTGYPDPENLPNLLPGSDALLINPVTGALYQKMVGGDYYDVQTGDTRTLAEGDTSPDDNTTALIVIPTISFKWTVTRNYGYEL